MLQQKLPGRISAVYLEPQGRGAVALGKAQVVKHRAGVEQLQVRLQSAAAALQRTEQEHAAGMVEKQVVFGVANVLGDVAHQRGVGDGDVGDGLGQLHNHD